MSTEQVMPALGSALRLQLCSPVAVGTTKSQQVECRLMMGTHVICVSG